MPSKLITHLTAAFMLCAPVMAGASTPGATSCAGDGNPACELRCKLKKHAADGKFIFGHHDDPVYGVNWWNERGRSDVYETAGDYPGLMNWDLGELEVDSAANLDGVSFLRIREEAKAQNARGGINAFSWHLRNPRTLNDSWTIDGVDATALAVTPGTPENERLAAWIAHVADFIGDLRDDNGRRIAVIFRPWHEHTGSWFWWGQDNTTDQAYKQLWKMTREIFDAKGVDNVLWAYSPDKVKSVEEYMQRYPGDEYVDILGADVYHFGGAENTAEYKERVASTLGAAKSVAEKTGKLYAFTETGNEGIAVPGWLRDGAPANARGVQPRLRLRLEKCPTQSKSRTFLCPVQGTPGDGFFPPFPR